MGRNLTSLPISASFQYLMQISGSSVTDGTGSLISSLDITASNATSATSASFATTATTATSATSATTAVSASFATTAASATSASYAVTASHALNAPTVNTGSLLTTASISDATITFTKGDASTFDIEVNNVSSSISASYATTSVSATSASYASTATSASHADNASTANSATTATSASHAVNADSAISASVADDLVSGANISISTITASNASFTSASITNLTTITGSIVQVGDAFVLLNTATPTSRYAGLKVEDSGSSPTNYTASFFFDSVTNDWNYEYSGSDPTNFGVALFGPEYSTKGSPVYNTNNRVVKGDGGHHIVDSTITDDGTTVSISASLNITGSGVAILSGSFSGSTIDNITDVYGTASVEHIVTLTQAQYDAISASADPNTYYIIEDAASFVTSASFASTVADGITINDPIISGSVNAEVQALTIVSNTASMDCSTGNFFTLTLASSATTHLDATNIQPGQTINIKIQQPATTGSLSFSQDFAFPTGSTYAGSAVGSAIDVISMVSFDSDKLYANQIENLV